MRPSWTRRLGICAIVGAVGWSSIGCAQERDPINRVQAGALSKHFLVGADLTDPSDDGEFYMRNTVIDVPYGAGHDGLFTASYAQPVSRIKWEITENALLARRTHENVDDTDHRGGVRRTNDGQVVAMFVIQSHFDIRYAYNPITGEEMNLVEENITDRPWYQREFIRVDWSQNLVTDGYEVDTLSQIGIFGGVKFSPMAYRVEDPSDPNAPLFDVDDGYFDVTTKVFATPQLIETPWGNYPSCFFFGNQGTNCNATEATLRLAFRKVVDTDYEPSEWDGNKMDAFGWFYEERFGYERNYGLSDQKWHRFASKYNIWEKSHVEGSQCAVDFYRDEKGNVGKYKPAPTVDAKTGLPVPDPNGVPYAVSRPGVDVHTDADNDGTEDECNLVVNGEQLHPGSRCDALTHKCTLPKYERKIRTIPWYYAPGSPADLFPSTKYALGQWNVAMQLAAYAGMRAEGERIGLDMSHLVVEEKALKELSVRKEALVHKQHDAELRGIGGGLTSEEQAELASLPQDVFVLCHSPSITKADAVRLGIDPDPEVCSPRGKSVSARVGDIRYHSVNLINDPQTPSPWGIMADANDPLTGEKVATSANEWVHVLDIYAQQTVDILRWMSGEIGEEQVRSGQYIRDWASVSRFGAASHEPKTIDRAEIESRMKSIQVANLSGASPAAPGTLHQMTPQQIDELVNRHAKTAQQLGGPSLDAEFEGFRQHLIGSKFEAMLATPQMVQAAGFDPQTPLAGNPAVLEQASPVRGMHPEMQRWMGRMRDTVAARRPFCMVEQPEPDSMIGLARHASRLYPMPEQNADFPANLAKRNAALLQWIREQFHVTVILHEMGHSMGLRHNFTGSWDAMNYYKQYWQLRTRNGEERACADPRQQHTDGRDCVGPRWIDPVTDEEVNGLVWKWGSSSVMDYPGDLTQNTNDLGAYDKAAVRFAYGDVIDVDVEWSPAKNRIYRNRLDGFGGIAGPLDTSHYSQLGDLVNPLGECKPPTDANDPLSAECTGFKLDYVSIYDTRPLGANARDAHHAVVTDGVAGYKNPYAGRVRHPYMFGSDEYADTGNIPVFRGDAGADAYEQMQFLVANYENRYIFDNFRRDRTNFHSRNVIQRTANRYFDRMTASAKALALYLTLLPEFKDELLSEPGYLMPHAIAASDSLAAFVRILTRPEPGGYVLNATGTAAEVSDASDLRALFTVPVGSGDGRFLHNDYDYSKGYNWGRYQTQVGSYYEKVYAVYFLLEAYNRFVQNNKRDYIDGRFLNLNYTSLYPEQMRRLFANLMQDDPTALGPYVDRQQVAANGNARVQYLPWEKYVPGDPGSTSMKYPQNATVLNPLVGWEAQFPALINAFYFGGTTLTMDWIQQMAVFSPGDLASFELPLSEQVRYTDPLTAVTYVARNYGSETLNGATVARSSGARMLEYAARLAAEAYETDGPPDPVTHELTYRRDPVTREPICKLTSGGVPDAAACEAAKAHIRRYSSNLDTIRQVGAWFGYGPLNRQY